MSRLEPVRDGVGRASGKVILFGEHAVVYGQPALAGPLCVGLCVRLTSRSGAAALPARLGKALALAALDFPVGLLTDLEVNVSGDLPEAVGLGSSAALSVALVRALADSTNTILELGELIQRANRVESFFHGRASGVDVAAAASPGWIRFTCGEPPSIQALTTVAAFDLVGIESGATHRTARTVGAVAARHAADRCVIEELFREIGAIVVAAETALGSGDLVELGVLMLENHRLLKALGVSTDGLDRAVTVARENGALGSKLTGGGGGGLAMALMPPGEGLTLVQTLARRGWSSRVLTFPTGDADATLGLRRGPS